MTLFCYQVWNYWSSVLGLFFNESVNDFLTTFFLAVSCFVLCCLRTLKENLAQKGPIMGKFSAVRSFLKSFYLHHACSHLLANSQYWKSAPSRNLFILRTQGLCDPGLATPDHMTIRPQTQVLCIWLTRLCYDLLILHLGDFFAVIPMSSSWWR